MTPIDPVALAEELSAAYALRRTDIEPPSSRDSRFTLDTAYAVEAELARRRVADGHKIVGWKIGYANKAVWRALKLDTLTWARMYDNTVRYAVDGNSSISQMSFCSPKIEPEVVVKLAAAVESAEPEAVLASVEWIALGFEIIDCVYSDWKFHPSDFVAAFGLHSALVVGQPLYVDKNAISTLVEQLAQFRVQLRRNNKLVEEGAGKNALRSPVLAVAELASAMSRRAEGAVLRPGDLISTGTLTTSQSIEAGQTWVAIADGIPLLPLSLSVTP